MDTPASTTAGQLRRALDDAETDVQDVGHVWIAGDQIAGAAALRLIARDRELLEDLAQAEAAMNTAVTGYTGSSGSNGTLIAAIARRKEAERHAQRAAAFWLCTGPTPVPADAGGGKPGAGEPEDGGKPWIHGSQLGRGHRDVGRHLVEDHGVAQDLVDSWSDGAVHGHHDGVHRTTWAYAANLTHPAPGDLIFHLNRRASDRPAPQQAGS
jgi:hypothetical protein